MMDRMRQRKRRVEAQVRLEALETRTLFSTTYAVMVMDAPQGGAKPVQEDADIPSQPVNPDSTLDSAIDLQVRVVSDGVYVTAAVTGVDSGSPDPTGTVDFYDEAGFLGTVALGAVYRNMIVVPAGEHTIFATYSGDENFLPTQGSISTLLTNPTTTLQPSTSVQQEFAKNSLGERVRPTRFLSETNFFVANGMAVSGDDVSSDTPAATQTDAGDSQAGSPAGGGNNDAGLGIGLTASADFSGPTSDGDSQQKPAEQVQALPPVQNQDPFDSPNDSTPPTSARFSTISFSIKVPKITHVG